MREKETMSRDDLWKRRALRFQEAYQDAQTTITAMRIQRMAWEADGNADAQLRRVVENTKTKMLAACIERNEYKARLEANRQVVFNVLQELQCRGDRQPVPSCSQCTEGSTPTKFDRGPCWYHRLLNLVGDVE